MMQNTSFSIVCHRFFYEKYRLVFEEILCYTNREFFGSCAPSDYYDTPKKLLYRIATNTYLYKSKHTYPNEINIKVVILIGFWKLSVSNSVSKHDTYVSVPAQHS